jgi:hypothetical protein
MARTAKKGTATAREVRLLSEAALALDQSGDGLGFDVLMAGDEVTLFPANGNNATLTITLKYSNGQPAPGKTVRCESRPLFLTGGEWRNVNALAPRFGKGEQTVRSRVAEGVVRLSVRVTPASAVTNSNGQAQFRLDSFHLCGNDGSPAADEILATSEGGTNRVVVKSAVESLGALSDNPGGGLTTSGLVGRHLHPQIIQVLQAIGQAWQTVQGKPPGMPNCITVTGASLRWGGLNPPHLTHRFGGTADVRPIGTREGPVAVGDAHYHRQATGIIVDFMKQTGASEIRFADNLPGVTAVDASHRDHIHVSWLKSPVEPWLTNLAATSAALKAAHFGARARRK